MSTPEDIYERIENRLVSHGIYVTDFERGDPLEITYETVHAGESGTVPDRDIGRLCNVLREFRAEGWEPVDLRAVVTDLEGERLGSWAAEAAWFRRLGRDEITETEFSQRVLETVETA
ncbi:hypothetical protein [Halorientalis pallida]|uniref:DUF8159 domain-containing protein n=1 Tax=Halorientalis pallida TaxID=2479928 RepID=A0A498KRP8_9EURY|nr:hypothetical protein [Halorientalis pallida]RXK46354.1 hypothetical protein EAF64_19950 [Halorientalis pallida]